MLDWSDQGGSLTMAVATGRQFLLIPRPGGGKPFEAIVDAHRCHVSTLVPMKSCGYVRATIDGRSHLLHRFLYEQRHGPLEADTVVRQTCGNRRCLNDDHHVAEDRYEDIAAGPNGEPVFEIPRPGGGIPLLAYVNERGCHICVRPGCQGAFGHVQIRIGGKKGRLTYAHRALFEDRHRVKLPEDVVVRHVCDEPACLNDRHHLTGDHNLNVQDRVLRQRSAILERNGRAKLDRAKVLDIFFSEEGPTVLAQRYGVDRRAITAIWNHEKWRSITHGLMRPGE